METLRTDVLVIGGGGAGSRAAYEAKRFDAGLRVTLVVEGAYGASGSTTFVGSETLGINAPLGCADPTDSPQVYLADMLDTGLGLASEELCRVIAYEASDRVEELLALGVEFDRKDGRLLQRKLSGCTKARSLSCGGQTGVQIVRALKRANEALGVTVYEHMRAVELIKQEGRVVGAICLREGQTPVAVLGRAVVLACGGAGRLFRGNINPEGIKGDGFAMAYRAGATLTNMEFIQVGPGVVFPPIRFIIHSHMWRFIPRLLNKHGEEFLGRYCPAGVSPADVLDLKAMSYPFSTRTDAKYLDIAIFKELMAGKGTERGGVCLDVTHVPRAELTTKAPITYDTLLKAGVDLASERVEIAPVVQSFNGGVRIDKDARTDVPGLFCAGEVSGGVHGADRPGGNNLIDSQVFGYRAGVSAAKEAIEAPVTWPDRVAEPEYAPGNDSLVRELQDLYYRHLTVVRDEAGLQKVLKRIEDLKERVCTPAGDIRDISLANALAVGEMVARSALLRRESRGTHYREDYPDIDPRFTRNILVKRGEGPEMSVEWANQR